MNCFRRSQREIPEGMYSPSQGSTERRLESSKAHLRERLDAGASGDNEGVGDDPARGGRSEPRALCGGAGEEDGGT